MKPYPKGQEIVRRFDDPIKKDSHLVILRGNLAPEGAVAKISGKEGLRFTGTARVFDTEEAALDGDPGRHHQEGRRHRDPLRRARAAAPACAKCSSPTSAIMGKGLGKDVALITDGRFSGGSHGFVVGHITPEAYLGGPIAMVKNGDPITIDAEKRQINLEISAANSKKRRRRGRSRHRATPAACLRNMPPR